MNHKYSRLQLTGAAILVAAVCFAAFAGFSILRNVTVRAAGPVAGSIVYMLLVPVVYALVVQFHRRISGYDRYRVGMGIRRSLTAMAKGFLAGLGLVVFAFVLVSVPIILFSADIDVSLSASVYSTMGFLLLALVTGAWEELVFRGLIFVSLLCVGLRRYYAALVSSALFVLPHIYLANPQYPAITLVGVFIFGMLLAQVYAYTGQIGWAIGLHAGWNFFALGIDKLMASTDGVTVPFGDTPQMFLELMQVAAILCVYGVYMYRKRVIQECKLEAALRG